MLLRLMSSRRVGLLLCLVGFVWGITLINMTLIGSQQPQHSSNQLRDEILQLSERYVRQLASETQDVIDGPYAGRLTGYDLKKTMAVLLENILTRMDRLEQRVDNTSIGHLNLVPLKVKVQDLVKANGEASAKVGQDQEDGPKQEPHRDLAQDTHDKDIAIQKPISAKDLILGAQEDCTLSAAEKAIFPHCVGKMSWMASHWKSDPCYSQYGVDGSDCSYRLYLSEIENWCPVLPGRKDLKLNITKVTHSKAQLNLKLDSLIEKLHDPGQRHNYEWMRQRITRMWDGWVAAAKNLAEKQDLSNRSQRKILVHLGLLSQKSGFKIAENSFKGGPLGELVQWSDIISALHILGHELLITSEVDQLAAALHNRKSPNGFNAPQLCPIPSRVQMYHDIVYTDIVGYRQVKQSVRNKQPKFRILTKFPSTEAQCQSREKLPIDMIYSDIVGLSQFKRKVRSGYGKFSCILRIIDSFGTEPAFNYDVYAKTHRKKTTWGMQNLNPKQFYTMFPHSPDNSFIGFVIENHLNSSTAKSMDKQNQAVVYGKQQSFWQGKDRYLEVIHKHVNIQATVFMGPKDRVILPSFAKNHGILPGPELHRLLRQSKVFVGLGFPYEGPAPLEAIAQGCVYLNPRFNPPHNSANTKFFKGKPTLRQLGSQHPYVEEFIGPPHVQTVNMDDPDSVERAVKEAIASIDRGEVKEYTPFEFTQEGMLQRVSSYIQHQDFCSPLAAKWPPQEAITYVTSDAGKSCVDACKVKGLMCEPEYFSEINSEEEIQRITGETCSEQLSKEDIYYPGVEARRGGGTVCYRQSQPLLYSCVGELPDLRRVCPCRDFIKGQIALCASCL